VTSSGGIRAPGYLAAAAAAASLAGSLLPWWSSGLGSAIAPRQLSALVLSALLLWAPNRGSLGWGGLAVLAGAGLSLVAFLIDRSPAPARTGGIPPR